MSTKNPIVSPLPSGVSTFDPPRGRRSLVLPVGSRLFLSTRASTLCLHLPKLGFLGRGTRLEALFWLVWTVHIGFFTRLVLTSDHASVERVVVLIPFYAIAVLLACRLLFGMFGHTTVELCPTHVAVVRRLLVWSWRRQAPSSHWLGARVRQRSTRRRVFTTCVLSVGVKEIEFGRRLSLAEQEWAVAVLNEW